MPDKIDPRKNQLFRLADPPGFIAEEQKVLMQSAQQSGGTIHVMAIYTGEKRPPKKGEWYLSGAEVEAYQAPNDLSTTFHIARLVLVKELDKKYTVISTIP